jgi:hypothetical protein
MRFQDISHFEKTADLLPMLNACIITDTLFMLFLTTGLFQSKTLAQWYHKFTLSAAIADILIIFIGILIARFFYPILFPKSQFNIALFAALALVIQIIHDLIFAVIINTVPRGQNQMIDTFKDYAKEMQFYAILGDSTMTLTAVLLSSLLANFSPNTNTVILAVVVYVIVYMTYQF